MAGGRHLPQLHRPETTGRVPFRKALSFSIIGHVVLLVALFWVQSPRPRTLDLTNSYAVSLVELPAPPKPAAPPAPAPEERSTKAPPPPKPTRAAQEKPKPKPTPARKEATPPPAKEAKPKQPESKPVPTQAPAAQVTPRPVPTAAAQPTPPAPTAPPEAERGEAATGPTSPGAAASVGSLLEIGPKGALGGGPTGAADGKLFPYPYYLRILQARVYENWEPFASAMTQSGEGRIVVSFQIERSGEITQVEVEEPSGNFFMDRSALRAVLAASPLPPLPDGFRDPYLRVHFGFTYAEEN